jgi:hypothetical protein
MNGGQRQVKEKGKWDCKMIGIFEEYLRLASPFGMKWGFPWGEAC